MPDHMRAAQALLDNAWANVHEFCEDQPPVDVQMSILRGAALINREPERACAHFRLAAREAHRVWEATL